jgi:hypothetical protein
VLEDTYLLATDGTLILAIPAFAPAFVIAGVVIVLAVRNRRHSEDGQDEGS